MIKLNISHHLIHVTLIAAFLSSTTAYAQLYEVPLDQRLQKAQVVVEGKVISKRSFWDEKHHNIHTSNIIEVYKIFKGNFSGSTIEMITVGGTVGDLRDVVTHSLQLEVGDVGTFTCIPNRIVKSDRSIGNGAASFQPCTGPQGFLKYDIEKDTAFDMFTKYNGIKTGVYNAITQRTGENYKTIKDADFLKK